MRYHFAGHRNAWQLWLITYPAPQESCELCGFWRPTIIDDVDRVEYRPVSSAPDEKLGESSLASGVWSSNRCALKYGYILTRLVIDGIMPEKVECEVKRCIDSRMLHGLSDYDRDGFQ